MFEAYVGHSNDPDSSAAIAEVLQQCQTGLAGKTPQAGVLFAAMDFDHSLILGQIQATFSGIELIGSTTNGEMSSVLGFQEDSLTLLVFCTDRLEIKAGLGRGLAQNTPLAVKEAIASATSQLSTPAQLCLTFPESIMVNGVSVLSALKQGLGTQLPILGAMAADDYNFTQTYQFFNSEVVSDAVPILLFAGELAYSHGVASGWQPLGKCGRVTKVVGNVILEIDGNRALDFYEHYLGDGGETTGYAVYALAVFEVEQENFYLRAPSSYDATAGTLTFFSDIPVGARVQITQAARTEIVAAADTSLQQALEAYPGRSPAAALLISCAARRRLLGTQASAEYESIKAKLPPNLPCCGLYSFGEISPLDRASETQFHNQTFVTLLLGET